MMVFLRSFFTINSGFIDVISFITSILTFCYFMFSFFFSSFIFNQEIFLIMLIVWRSVWLVPFSFLSFVENSDSPYFLLYSDV